VQISITARQCEITSGIRQFAQQRLEKLEKFASDIHGVHLIVSLQHGEHSAEIKLRLNGHELVSTQEHAEAGAAIERAVDRMEEQLRRHKDKRTARKHQSVKTAGADGAPASHDDLDEELD